MIKRLTLDSPVEDLETLSQLVNQLRPGRTIMDVERVKEILKEGELEHIFLDTERGTTFRIVVIPDQELVHGTWMFPVSWIRRQGGFDRNAEGHIFEHFVPVIAATMRSAYDSWEPECDSWTLEGYMTNLPNKAALVAANQWGKRLMKAGNFEMTQIDAANGETQYRVAVSGPNAWANFVKEIES